MAVALLLCVAIFITALYNLCKTYLGNSPRMIEPTGNIMNEVKHIEMKRGLPKEPPIVNPTKQPDNYIKFEVLPVCNIIF